MEELNKIIETAKLKLKKGNASFPYLTEDSLDNLYSVYPFNRFEYIISHLISDGILTIEDYRSLREAYHKRNKFLYLFEITAPRHFGETWAQRHLNEVIPELERPAKGSVEGFDGEYDFYWEGVRIEVKASRATERKAGTSESLVSRALNSLSDKNYAMNFQQIKPACFDVIVFIAVWTDVIRYWVFSREEIESNPHFSGAQHRGNKGEGQLWFNRENINDFSGNEVSVREVFNTIRKKGKGIQSAVP